MDLYGENPFQTIGEMAGAQDELRKRINKDVQELADEFGRENVVMALEGYAFDLKNRNFLNTYEISDDLFEELHYIKDEYDIEIDVSDLTVEEFVSIARKGNPLMMSRHQWPSVREWETEWSDLRELQAMHGDKVLKVFFDLVIFTDEGYHQRKKYVDAIVDEYAR